MNWVAMRVSELILCVVKAIPRSIIFSLVGTSQRQKIKLFWANGTTKPLTPIFPIFPLIGGIYSDPVVHKLCATLLAEQIRIGGPQTR